MIKNYLLIALRNLKKNVSYVLINTFGLGIALACCITAYLLLAFNIEFDDFHDDTKVENVFVVHSHFIGNDGRPEISNTTPLMLAPEMAEDVAGVEQYTRFITESAYMRYRDMAFDERLAFADSNFFRMFDFPVSKGSTQSFKHKYTVIISERVAEKYFGKDDPIGKTMVLNFQGDKQLDVSVGAVLTKIQVNNTFGFDVMLRFENYFDIQNLTVDNWGDWRDPSAFVEVTTPEVVPTINKQLNKYIARRNEARKDVVTQKFQLEPFKSKFTEDDISRSYVNMRMSKVPLIVFTVMAAMILLIACFNLTNTSIAMTAKRLKEVGVRKTIGAARLQIVWQFILETVMSIVLAMIVGVGISQVIVPAFAEMWRLPYGLQDLNGLNFFVAIVFMIFLVAILAGIYPALSNSKFNPVTLLKGNAKVKGSNFFSQSLVSLQFAISVIVLIAGVIFIQNTNYQAKIKFGYDTKMVFNVAVQSAREFEAMETLVKSNPKVLNVAVTSHQVGFSVYQSPVKVDTTEYDVQHLGVGKNYFETMGFTLASGRWFNTDNASDVGEGAIVNKAFLDKAGMDSPLEKVVEVHGVKRRIVGVIENHIDNLFRSKEAEPFVFYPILPESYKLLVVRTETGDIGTVHKFVEDTWKKTFPAKPFQSWMQEDIVLSDMERTNGNLKSIFIFLTILGGILSCAGIFSLASLNVAKRTKEIGIRKTLGASVPHVVTLLNKEFMIVLFIAAVLGSVGGFFGTQLLLDEIYTQHVTIGIVTVVLCALFIFLIGISTTSTTILRAARSNPVKTLRTE